LWELNHDFGNWRAKMPIADRKIFVRTAVEGDPPMQGPSYPTLMPALTVQYLLRQWILGPAGTTAAPGPPTQHESEMTGETVAKAAMGHAEASTAAADLITRSLTMAAPPVLGINSATRVTNPFIAQAAAADANMRQNMQEYVSAGTVATDAALQAQRLQGEAVAEAMAGRLPPPTLLPPPGTPVLLTANTLVKPGSQQQQEQQQQQYQPQTLQQPALIPFPEPAAEPSQEKPAPKKDPRPAWALKEMADHAQPIWAAGPSQWQVPWAAKPTSAPTTPAPTAMDELRSVETASEDVGTAAMWYAQAAGDELMDDATATEAPVQPYVPVSE